VCIAKPEAFDGARLVGVDLDEILRAGHRQHRLDPLLDAGQLQVTAGVVDLAVEIHEAADGGAVHVGDRREIDEDLPLAGRDQAADRGRKVGKDRIHEPRLADATIEMPPACSVLTFISGLPCA